MEDTEGFVDPDKLTPVKKEPFILRVANATSVHDLATSIICNIEENRTIVLSCIGVSANAQAVKAIAVANGKLAPQGFMLLILPSFGMTKINDGVERTVIRHTVVKYLVGS